MSEQENPIPCLCDDGVSPCTYPECTTEYWLRSQLASLRDQLAAMTAERDAAQGRAVTNQNALARLWADTREADERAEAAETRARNAEQRIEELEAENAETGG